MRMRLLLLLLPLCLPAQVITVDAGAITDQFFTGGTVFTDPVVPDVVLSTLRFGTSFRYEIPVPELGLYDVKITVVEPNQNAINKRVFTIGVNGAVSGNIDPFKLGGRQPVTLNYLALSSTGIVALQFTGKIGNAIVNKIEVKPSQLLAPVITVQKVTDTTPNSFPIPAGKSICIVSRNIAQSPDEDYVIFNGQIRFKFGIQAGDMVQLVCF